MSIGDGLLPSIPHACTAGGTVPLEDEAIRYLLAYAISRHRWDLFPGMTASCRADREGESEQGEGAPYGPTRGTATSRR